LIKENARAAFVPLSAARSWHAGAARRIDIWSGQQANGAEVMATASSAARRVPEREQALKSLYADVAAKNMFPFWATSADVDHDEIKQLMGTARAIPFLWR
jgi:hypothetical protein